MTTVQLIDDRTVQVLVEPEAPVQVLVQPEPIVHVEVLDGGMVFEGINPFSYREFTYTLGDLTRIDEWASSAKVTKLFTKTFLYTSGDLTHIVTVNERDSTISTKILSYVGGDLTSIDVVTGDQSPP